MQNSKDSEVVQETPVTVTGEKQQLDPVHPEGGSSEIQVPPEHASSVANEIPSPSPESGVADPDFIFDDVDLLQQFQVSKLVICNEL